MFENICSQFSMWLGTQLASSSDCLSAANTFLWMFTLLAGAVTIVIYFLQWRAMQNAVRAQDLAWLIQYLQAQDVRDAREFVLAVLKNWQKPWDDDAKKMAATACAAYGVAGIYIRTNRIDRDAILDNWGPSIEEVCKVCADFIAERRAANGPRYWEALIEINELAKKANEKNRSKVSFTSPTVEASHEADSVDGQRE